MTPWTGKCLEREEVEKKQIVYFADMSMRKHEGKEKCTILNYLKRKNNSFLSKAH
jgi:hypothetical protein